MNASAFVDTNILVYAHDVDAGRKHDIAAALLRDLWDQQGGIISTQVMQEFYVNVTRKISQPIAPATARGILSVYSTWHVEIVRPQHVLQAAEIQERHQLSFWDAMIIVTAMNGNATVLLTEDLNSGQIIEGIEVHNPFL